MKVLLHADDYGFSEEVSEDIIDCYKDGTLHGISIMPNSTYFEKCMNRLSEIESENADKKLQKSIHFSISEGPCLADKKKLPLLVDERGMFKLSFFKLLILSKGSKKKELKKELKIELKAQYEKALPYLDSVDIDSHVHYHMIPIVLETIVEIVKESGREIGYLRVPAEAISPFLKHPSLYFSYSPINLVKNIVLNWMKFKNRKILKSYKDKTSAFFGIVMSGHMDIKRVSKLMPDFVKIANKKGMNLEILAHPGHVTNKDTLLDPYNEEYSKAPLSKNRLIEKNMFMEIHKYL